MRSRQTHIRRLNDAIVHEQTECLRTKSGSNLVDIFDVIWRNTRVTLYRCCSTHRDVADRAVCAIRRTR